MLDIANLSLGYGGRTLVQAMTFSASPGELQAVIGPNGAGKSTVLKAVAGLVPIRSGAMHLDGVSLPTLTRTARARRLAYLAQHATPAAVTVYEAIVLGRLPHLGWQLTETDLAVVDELIAGLGLGAFAGRLCIELSGGELQKVLIARALAQTPRLLLLDEPVNHLDWANQLEILALLRRLAQERALIVLAVFHDLNLAMRFADRFLLLDGRGHYCSGAMHELTATQVAEVYQISVVRRHCAGYDVFIPQ